MTKRASPTIQSELIGEKPTFFTNITNGWGYFSDPKPPANSNNDILNKNDSNDEDSFTRDRRLMESHEGGFDNLRVSLDDDCIDYRNRSTGTNSVASVIQVHIVTFTRQQIDVFIEPGKTIRDLKKVIQEKIGMGVEQQNLLLDGVQLEDLQTIYASGITPNTAIHLIMKLA